MTQPSLFDAAAPAPEPARVRASKKTTVDAPAHPQALQELGRQLPAGVHLGTSSWSFPGWEGLVYAQAASESLLSREGLNAYGRHPLLRSVSLDRTFYAPISEAQYARYAAQVPAGFRFVVKAPNLVTDAVLRDDKGGATGPNPSFLDAAIATEHFVDPCLAGLGAKAGPLVFQFSPFPLAMLADPAEWVARLRRFLEALPPLPASNAAQQAFYAVEFRDAEVITPRLARMLQDIGVRYCVAIHARLPAVERQLQAHAATGPGPLVVRWNLLAGHRYDAAKAKFAPFDKIVVPDPVTRRALARAAREAQAGGAPVWIVANNKAEGSAPLTVELLAREITADPVRAG